MPVPKMLREGFRVATLAALVVVGRGSPASADMASRQTPVTKAVAKVQNSVVNISSEKKAASTSRWPFSAEESQRPRVSGMGTGVIVDGRGYILTNYHVVDKVQGVEVHLLDGSSYSARVIQQDKEMDLAVLKVDAGRPLPAVNIGNSSDLMVGETVITLGNAFGYENTVSVGIVSALKRNVTLSDEQVYRNLIQTDACINPGNSGGPLINIDGDLVGINVATRQGAQGIGFALPIDDVKRVATEMMSTRRLAMRWHGLVADEAGVGIDRRVVLADVQTGSPAEAAGFRAGDQVLKVGEFPVSNVLDIERGLLDVEPGRPSRVVVVRDGKEQLLSLDVRPLNRGSVAVASAPANDSMDAVWSALGLKVIPVASEYVAAASTQLHGGLYVERVSPNSPGGRAQIQKGDILVGMNVGNRHWETIQPDNVLYILRQPEVAQSQMLPYYIVRRNVILQGAMSLADSPRPAESTARR
ncbi:trypsin-like peptidase domain-containing protein [Tundrisphaera sp. TA3]|uniref:S1C family serine protease n=1 Tax=Tundrisphaera sp. TA3 TaxID=3435775 RepID=UPI003EBC5F14